MATLNKALEAWFSIQPLSVRNEERLSKRFTIDYNYNSNHIEGNTLTYGQTEILLMLGKIIGEAYVRDVEEMTASNVGLKMMTEEARVKSMPLTQNSYAHFTRLCFVKTTPSIATCLEECKQVMSFMQDNTRPAPIQ